MSQKLSSHTKTKKLALDTLTKTTTESLRQILRGVFARRSRYLLHGSVLALGVFLAVMNVYAQTNDEIVRSERNILAQLVFPEQDRYEVVTADSGAAVADVPDSYVPSSVAVASAASAEGSLTDDALIFEEEDAMATDPYALPSINGDTLVKASPSDTKESSKPRTGVVTYTVREDESVTSIARKFGVDVATVLQENRKYANDIIKAGDELTILPYAGATERVDEGEALSTIASKHDVSVEDIMEANDLFSDDEIEVAQILIIPDGKRDTYVGARPVPVVAAATTGSSSSGSRSSGGSSASSATGGATPPAVVTPRGSAGNRFPWGWCTWYVAEKRGDVSWRGNAGQWLGNAAAQGRPTGRMPAVGAILVTSESWWGHVAYVEAVNGDSVTVSEMNYRGFGITSTRTISNGSGVIKGYIY